MSQTTINLPQKVEDPVVPVLRSRGLLVQVADAVTSPRWQGGVTFVGYDASNHPVSIALDWCAPDDLDARTPSASEIPAFQAFSLWDGETCSTLAVEPQWLTARTHHRVDISISTALAFELLSGFVTGNPSLQSTASTVAGGAYGPKAALMRLEMAWTAQGSNQRADIHMPPALLIALAPYLVAVERSVEILAADGTTTETETVKGYETPMGNRVIFDGGYGVVGGVAPGGAFADTDRAWIYASGPVAVQVGPTLDNDVAGSHFYDRNEFNARSHAMGLVVFDPDTVFAVEVDISDALIDV